MGKHSQNNKNNQNNSNNTTRQPAQSSASITLDDIEKLLKKQSKELKDGFDGKFGEHEGRLKKLENAVFKQSTGGSSSANTASTAATSATTAAAANTTAGSASATQTASTTPPASQPVVQGDASWRNGPGYAYTYWDYKAKCWQLSSDIWAAKQASNGTYSIVWVYYKNGVIDHLLSDEEIKKYAP